MDFGAAEHSGARGSSHVSASALDITFSPSPDLAPAPTRAQAPARLGSPAVASDTAPRISWPLWLVSSYASAVTLALGFVLLTGRGLRTPDPAASPEDVADTKAAASSANVSRPAPVMSPLPAPNVTGLGQSVRLGDLEVTPRSIARRPVALLRLQGEADDQRESSPVLVLSMELANRSASSAFAPLDISLVRDSIPTVDQSFIDVPGGRHIAMFRLAVESEWSIQDQVLPTLQPGETAQTIVVSEPVEMTGLTGTMTWHVKVRTAPFRTDVLGVRFTSDQVANETE
jgi:hypothetical protein